MKSINVYGLGYIGLPTAALLANKGYSVLGIDISNNIVDSVNKGKVHIVEPHLQELVKNAVSSKKLKASVTPEGANIHMIAVPTPFKNNYEPDLKYVFSATKTICSVLKNNDLIILESTSPVGTTEKVLNLIKKTLPHIENIYLAYSPERVIPGKVIQELTENDRIIGGVNNESTLKAVEFYKTFVNGKVLATNAKTAEMCKLTENSFRDVNIAFANELSIICKELNIDVWELIKLANCHPRVNILNPGPGVGGHCIAVDPWFIVNASPQKAKLIKQARIINDGKPHWVIEQIMNEAKNFTKPVIACLGASFKADIDDLRESPALKIINSLQNKNIGKILTVEPNILFSENLELVELNQALELANIIVILVDHKEFKNLNKNMFSNKITIDTRGILK